MYVEAVEKLDCTCATWGKPGLGQGRVGGEKKRVEARPFTVPLECREEYYPGYRVPRFKNLGRNQDFLAEIRPHGVRGF